jgi:hypothetical protein
VSVGAIYSLLLQQCQVCIWPRRGRCVVAARHVLARFMVWYGSSYVSWSSTDAGSHLIGLPVCHRNATWGCQQYSHFHHTSRSVWLQTVQLAGPGMPLQLAHQPAHRQCLVPSQCLCLFPLTQPVWLANCWPLGPALNMALMACTVDPDYWLLLVGQWQLSGTTDAQYMVHAAACPAWPPLLPPSHVKKQIMLQCKPRKSNRKPNMQLSSSNLHPI